MDLSELPGGMILCSPVDVGQDVPNPYDKIVVVS